MISPVRAVLISYKRPTAVSISLFWGCLVGLIVSAINGPIAGFWIGAFAATSLVPILNMVLVLIRSLGISKVRLLFQKRFFRNIVVGLAIFGIPWLILHSAVQDAFINWLFSFSILGYAMMAAFWEEFCIRPDLTNHI